MSRSRAPTIVTRALQGSAMLTARSPTDSIINSVAWTAVRGGLPALLCSFANRPPTVMFQGSFAVRPLSGAAAGEQGKRESEQRRAEGQSEEVTTVEDERFSAITDQIPQRPMGVVEGTSYTLVIIAGIAVAAAVLWAVVNDLLLQPREYTAFNLTLERLRDDPRVTVRLGTPVSGYGQETRNRAARQRIPHRLYTDAAGHEHVQVQFMARGPSGVGRVSADLYQDAAKAWQYYYLYLDVDVPVPQRLVLVSPQYQ